MKQIRPVILLVLSILLLVPIVFATEKEQKFGLNDPVVEQPTDGNFWDNDPVVSTAIAPDVNGKKIPPPPPGFDVDITEQYNSSVAEHSAQWMPKSAVAVESSVSSNAWPQSVYDALDKEADAAEVNLVREVQYLRKLVELSIKKTDASNEKLIGMQRQINALAKIVEIQHRQIVVLTNATTNRQGNGLPVTIEAEAPSAIESEIDGEFNGWEGETIFKLTNGQIWQQVGYDYVYEYAYMPEVVIYETNGTYKMKVEDVEDTIEVVRIK